MPQISTLGVTYSTISAWFAAEGSIDYGVGNPIILFFETLVNESVALTGTCPRGFVMLAASGFELNKETLVGVGNLGDTRPNISTPDVTAEFRDIIVSTTNTGSTTDLLYEDCLFDTNFHAGSKKVTLRGTIHKGCSRALDATSSNAFAIAENVTVIDGTGSFDVVRFHNTNVVSIGGSGTAFVQSVAGSDFNASDDTSSPGANSLDNITTEAVVNYSGNDYRTAQSSPLATAGDGVSKDYIGFAFEAAEPLNNEINAALSLSNNSTITLKSQKLSQAKTEINNNTLINIKGQKLSNACLSNAALGTANINSSKQVSTKISTNSVNTINMSCFKQAYGSLPLSNVVVVTLNGQKVMADTRSAVLFLNTETAVTLKTQKLARSQLSLQAVTNVNVYIQKNSASSLTTTSLSTITINGSKVSTDSRNVILSISNTTIVSIEAHKKTTANLDLSNTTNVTVAAQKTVRTALNLQNFVITKITKYSDSYIPVVRRLCIQGQIVTLSIPANINNKLIIQGCF